MKRTLLPVLVWISALAACAQNSSPVGQVATGSPQASAATARGIVKATQSDAPGLAAARPGPVVVAVAPTPVVTPPAAIATAPAPATAPSVPAMAPPPPPILPFDDAVMNAANALFTNARLSSVAPDKDGKYRLIIDPLVDGNSGVQSLATQTMESRVTGLLAAKYPQFSTQPFGSASLARAPLLFIGTFTAVDREGKNAGAREWYRICLALIDVRAGVIVSKGFARAHPAGIDNTPTAFFLDSPAWAPDRSTDGYVRTCQGTKAGDPINPVYWDRLVAAAMINDALIAYAAGRYEEALDLYKGIARTPAGNQLRVYNGIYLASWKLGRRDEAAQAFSRIVDFGLEQDRLAVKFLFRPGSTAFVNDPQAKNAYAVWLRQIALRSSLKPVCMEISGHTSRTGAEPLNDRLSLMRAQHIRQRLDTDAPGLARRTVAQGKGARENISGLGTDDARDALDRRVEFKVQPCPAT